MADLSSSKVEVHEMNAEEKSSSHKKLLSTSIYHLYTPGQRRLLLLAAACISFLTPFTDTVYLPALTSVADTFDANDTLVALTVSIYLACVGLGQLFWGPLSDHYGRTIVLYVVLVIYEGLTIGCIFSDSIAALIILRSLQGLFVGCTIVSAQALIADIFPADELGEATGAFMAPMLFGPILAPIVGGILSQAFGWRSTFVLLAIMTGPIALFTLLVVPETHQWFVVQRIDRVNESRTSSMKAGGSDYQIVEKQEVEEEVGDVESPRKDEEEGKATVEQEVIANNEKTTVTESSKSKKIYQADKANEVYHLSKKENTIISIENKEQIIRPPFISPWEVFQFALDKDLAPFYAIQCLSFSVMFTCLTVAPLKLSDDPYNLSESIIGLTYLPIGVAMLLGSMVGGILSDKAAGMFPEIPEARLLYSLYPKATVIIGGVIFGYSLEEEVNLSVVLISQFLIGFGQSVIMTMVLSFLTSARPKSSAGVAAVMMFLCFAAAAVFVSISVDVSNAIGEGGYFVILSGLFLLACIASLYYLSLKFTWFQLSLLSSAADDDFKLEKYESKSDEVQSIELTVEKREEL